MKLLVGMNLSPDWVAVSNRPVGKRFTGQASAIFARLILKSWLGQSKTVVLFSRTIWILGRCWR